MGRFRALVDRGFKEVGGEEMSRIKERLKQYKGELSKYSKYETILVGTVMDILEELQDDLKQDEKEKWLDYRQEP